MSPAGPAAVAAYYEAKTESILRRYGPGPRVHFHTGLPDAPLPRDAAPGEIRALLVKSQERLLARAAATWGGTRALGGDVLDVGCGLGGGSLYWAQEHGARVTSVTNVASHAARVTAFARAAGVGERVRPLVTDALEVPGAASFDATVAIESACYFPRERWMRRVFELLRPGGGLFIADCFLGDEAEREPFDAYWKTRIGSVESYVDDARGAGFEVRSVVELSREAARFWDFTLELMDLESGSASGHDAARLAISRLEHVRLRDGLDSGRLRYALLAFGKPA